MNKQSFFTKKFVARPYTTAPSADGKKTISFVHDLNGKLELVPFGDGGVQAKVKYLRRSDKDEEGIAVDTAISQKLGVPADTKYLVMSGRVVEKGLKSRKGFKTALVAVKAVKLYRHGWITFGMKADGFRQTLWVKVEIPLPEIEAYKEQIGVDPVQDGMKIRILNANDGEPGYVVMAPMDFEAMKPVVKEAPVVKKQTAKPRKAKKQEEIPSVKL